MPKNIVICCDGTSNQFGKNNTNVVKIYDMIIADKDQINFYDPGVGTTSRQALIPFRWLSNMFRQGLGLDLARNVEDAYRFLMRNYEDGDKIFLFGFSRGAHTVRRLANILDKLGLLYRGSDNMTPYVMRMYEKNEEQDVINAFKHKFTRKCPVHFLGVWDTVSALSRIIPRPKLDGELGDNIAFAYHAVSLDEARLQFPANLFQKKEATNQTIEEVWFTGVHSDVGGSYPQVGLSNITLKWMTEKAVAAGLKIYPDLLEKVETNPLEDTHWSWFPKFIFIPWHVYAILILAIIGVIQIIIAQLSLFWPETFHMRPFYDVLSYISSDWKMTLMIAFALIFGSRYPRKIPKNAKIHSSVKVRMDKLGYKPKTLERVLDSIEWAK